MNEWICISTTTGKLSDCKCQSPNAFWCQVLNFIPLVIKNQRISLQGLRWWSVAKTQSSQCRGPSPIPDQESRSHMPKLKPSTARQINKNKFKKKKRFSDQDHQPSGGPINGLSKELCWEPESLANSCSGTSGKLPLCEIPIPPCKTSTLELDSFWNSFHH